MRFLWSVPVQNFLVSVSTFHTKEVREYHTAVRRNDILTHATTCAKSENIMLIVSKPDSKEQILYDSTCMRYPKYLNSSTQEGEWWLQGLWESKGSSYLTCTEFQFGVKEKCGRWVVVIAT